MDDLIRLDENSQLPVVDLTEVHLVDENHPEPVNVPILENGTTLNDQTYTASATIRLHHQRPCLLTKHKTDPIGDSLSPPKVLRLSDGNNDIYGSIDLEGPESTYKINSTRNVSDSNLSKRPPLCLNSCKENVHITSTSNSPFKKRFNNKLNNNETVPDNNYSHSKDIDDLTADIITLEREINNLEAAKAAFGFPSQRTSKKDNCTITSGDYSLLNLDEKVPSFRLIPDSSQPRSSSNKHNLNKTYIKESLNAEKCSPLIINDSTPSCSFQTSKNHNSKESVPLDGLNHITSNEQRGLGPVHKNGKIKSNKVAQELVFDIAQPTQLPDSYSPLLEMFSDIDINFLKELINLGFNLEQIVDHIMEMNNEYPKSQKSVTPMNSNIIPGNKTVASSTITNEVVPNCSNVVCITSSSTTNTAIPTSSNMIPGNTIPPTRPDIEEIVLDLSSTSHVISLEDDENSGASTEHTQIKTLEPNKFSFLQEILPDADPEFLQKISKFDEEKMRQIINESIEINNYPKISIIKEIPKEKENEDDNIELYSTNFDLLKFMKIFPAPCTYFKDPERVCQYNEHAKEFLKKRFRKCYINTITKVYKEKKYNLTLTCEALDKEKTIRNSKRPLSEIHMPNTVNLPFLQEACFIEHMEEINSHIKKIEETKKAAYDLAQARGELIECGCCYDNVLFENCATCTEGDLFCKACIQRSAEVRIGDGMTTFPCLSDCGSNFSLQTLQDLLEARIFSKLLQRIQMEEVRSADIEGLEMCPFCEFATIPPPDNKIFTCMNPDCLKESCRQCHKVNHIPMRCEEVENDDQAKARKYIEDEMTKALVRECHRCKKSFIKTDGCNKMTCTCGAKMCYICREPIVDYKHFNGPGGSESNKCPLYSSDNVLHVEAVKETAQKAMEKVAAENPSLNLKHDPTKLLPATIPDSQLPPGVVENPRLLLQRMFGIQGGAPAQNFALPLLPPVPGRIQPLLFPDPNPQVVMPMPMRQINLAGHNDRIRIYWMNNNPPQNQNRQ